MITELKSMPVYNFLYNSFHFFTSLPKKLTLKIIIPRHFIYVQFPWDLPPNNSEHW